MFIRKFSTAYIQTIKKDIAKHQIMLYSKTYCPYCRNAKNVFQFMEISPFIIELDKESNTNEIEESLEALTKQTTVPNIFITGVHIGGYTDLLQWLKSGKLEKLLTDEKIPFKKAII